MSYVAVIASLIVAVMYQAQLAGKDVSGKAGRACVLEQEILTLGKQVRTSTQ